MSKKILLPGGAGLVGQNLVARLKAKGYTDIVVLDKHRPNLEVLKRVQPDITVEMPTWPSRASGSATSLAPRWWSCCRPRSAASITRNSSTIT